jgi:photosystem II stability/assembly factor-like uncharacterized protein
MFNPTISPNDPNTVLVSCDMTGSYITHDGGNTWRMFNLRGDVNYFVFDPVDPKTIYAATKALWRSTDAGETWRIVYPKAAAIREIQMNSDHAGETIVARPDPLGNILALAIDPDAPQILYAASAQNDSFAVWVSRDKGDTWQQLQGLKERPLRMWVDPHSPRLQRKLYIAASHSISIATSSGLQTLAMPAGASDVSLGFPSSGQAVIYAVSENTLFVSSNSGTDWQKSELPARGARLDAIATSRDHPEIAYVSYSHLQETMRPGRGSPVTEQWMGVAKTTDTGRTWHLVWRESDRAASNVHDAWISARFGPRWPGNPLALGIAQQNPDLVYATDLGRTMRSSDGGANWTAVYSRRTPADGWTSTGLDVTTSYGVHFDPFDSQREFITYTDIGLFRSEDGGQSWQSSTTGVPQRWVNTTYWIVFDPNVRGRMWSVNSSTHDLPRPKMWRRTSVLQYRGGVCRSDDGGRTWVKSNTGMDETAPTHILIDPVSPPNARILYVAAFGRGVYKSSDDGRTWMLKNKGISQSQPLAWRLVRDSAGTLYVILARRSENGSIGNDGDGAIYRSRDGAETWQQISLPAGVNGPNGLAVDPRDPGRMYLAAWARAAGVHGEGGGIFLSEDGGKSWGQVLEQDRHVYDVTIHSSNPDWLYAAGFESSAWRSIDRGQHWTRIPGFNFKWAHRVIPDPQDHNSVYVTTFGGSVWHGLVNGDRQPIDVVTPEMEPRN